MLLHLQSWNEWKVEIQINKNIFITSKNVNKSMLFEWKKYIIKIFHRRKEVWAFRYLYKLFYKLSEQWNCKVCAHEHP